jgi:hypothetical protein
MKSGITLRLFAVALTTVLLTTGATTLRAIVFHDNGPHRWEKEKEKERDKREYRQVPEGGAGAISLLAAVALGSGVLVWRRKNRATVV